ncbi:hypothetical protein ABPG72_006756 [Tetrahymena utriculariae]
MSHHFSRTSSKIPSKNFVTEALEDFMIIEQEKKIIHQIVSSQCSDNEERKESFAKQMELKKAETFEISKASSVQTIFRIICNMVGSSILALPPNILKGGLIMSLILMTIIGYVSYKTCSIIVLYQRKGELDLLQVVQRILGKKWCKMFFVTSCLLLFILGIIYFLLMNRVLYPITKQCVSHLTSEQYQISDVPQTKKTIIYVLREKEKVYKNIDKQSIDVNNPQRSFEYNNSQFQQNILPSISSNKTNNNYINRLKILTKPPLHQRIQQAINSKQQAHQTSSSLQASQIQLSSQEKQIKKEIFQLQAKYQQAKNSQISTNNFICQNDETSKYRVQNNQQGDYSIQQPSSQQLNGYNNFIQNSSPNINQTTKNVNTPILANNSNNYNQVTQQNQNQTQTLNPIQKRKRNFNIQINNNINFFIQNGTNSNNSSLNNSFHNSNQLPESLNENIPSKSFNSTPLGTNRQQYSRQNKHTNKSQNSNQNTTNPNLSALLQQENIMFNKERSNSLNHPNVQNKRSKHYYQNNQNSNALNYSSVQNSPNTSFQIMNTSTPQNFSTLFPLFSENKNAPRGQAIFNTSHNNQQNFINSNQIQIQNSISQTTKTKPSPQLKDIIFATGNQSVKRQAQREIPINFGLPSSTKNPYINNKNQRKCKLASEIINF